MEPETEILYDTPGEAAAMGAIIGLPVGAAIGGLTILFKKSKYYLINGDKTNWKVFQLTTESNVR